MVDSDVWNSLPPISKITPLVDIVDFRNMQQGSHHAVLFILGAGASVDSGMKVYRGGGGGGTDNYYGFNEDDPKTNPLHISALGNNERMAHMWHHLMPIIKDRPTRPGPTYQKIEAICDEHEHAMVANQNIDGLADLACGSEMVVNMHGDLDDGVCLDCHTKCPLQDAVAVFKCPLCGGWLRPNIVLFGESLADGSIERVFRFIANRKPSACYVIGSSMRFPYLFSIIKKAKAAGAKIIHVNTDPDYKWHMQREQWNMNSVSGQLSLTIIKKKKPELLIKEL